MHLVPTTGTPTANPPGTPVADQPETTTALGADLVAQDQRTRGRLKAPPLQLNLRVLLLRHASRALESFTNILTPLCAVVDVPGCISMLSGSDTCYRPIPVSLPGYLDIGGCLVGELMDTDAGPEVATALSCTVVTLVQSAASSGGLFTRVTLGTLTTLVSTTIT
ncbi:hypothetical protein MTO96_025961, partial [Rhipicephalus appendiculatus]